MAYGMITRGLAQRSPIPSSPDLSAAFTDRLGLANAHNVRSTSAKISQGRARADGSRPAIDFLPAIQNISQRVPNVTHPVALYAVTPESALITYNAQRLAGGVITLTTRAHPSHPLDGQAYRLIPGSTPTILVNGVSLRTLPSTVQHEHLFALSHALAWE
jgi:hypothetical protein